MHLERIQINNLRFSKNALCEKMCTMSGQGLHNVSRYMGKPVGGVGME